MLFDRGGTLRALHSTDSISPKWLCRLSSGRSMQYDGRYHSTEVARCPPRFSACSNKSGLGRGPERLERACYPIEPYPGAYLPLTVRPFAGARGQPIPDLTGSNLETKRKPSLLERTHVTPAALASSNLPRVPTCLPYSLHTSGFRPYPRTSHTHLSSKHFQLVGHITTIFPISRSRSPITRLPPQTTPFRLTAAHSIVAFMHHSSS